MAVSRAAAQTAEVIYPPQFKRTAQPPLQEFVGHYACMEQRCSMFLDERRRGNLYPAGEALQVVRDVRNHCTRLAVRSQEATFSNKMQHVRSHLMKIIRALEHPSLGEKAYTLDMETFQFADIEEGLDVAGVIVYEFLPQFRPA